MRFAVDGHEMMLTMRIKGDVLLHKHLVIIVLIVEKPRMRSVLGVKTAENIAVVIWNILREKIDDKLDLKITLYETERNFVEYPAS